MKYLILSVFMSASLTAGAQFISNTGVKLRNGVVISTNGAWFNAAGTSIQNDGTIRTSNDFVNEGQLDDRSTGSFLLRYSTDHNFQPGGTAIRVLAKEGAGTALLMGTIQIKDSLLLWRGLLKVVNSADTVSLHANATVVADTGSYVNGGLIARAGVGDLLFPLGKDGYYLPLKLHQADARRITASVEDTPAGHTAGSGVASLIDFPYAWRVIGSQAADTAGYVEINYPNTLPMTTDLIVARQIPGSQFASMGARFTDTPANRVTLVSYSRRLNGLFTVAQGAPGDFVTDSLALVSLYQATGGESWTNRTNWLAAPVASWYGVTVNGQRITGLNLANNQLAGPIPNTMADVLSLEAIDVSGNEITALPDFAANTAITSLNVSDNHLNFASLEPNTAVPNFTYQTQADIGTAIDTTLQVGSSYVFSAAAGGTNSIYTWIRNDEPLAGSTGPTYYLPAINRENMGEYKVEVANTLLPGLILKSPVMKVLAHATLTGQLFADSETPAQAGTVTLYKMQPGGFLPTTTTVGTDGTYAFTKVVLDNYQLLGEADTTLYPDALPTYYESTTFWEQADSIVVSANTPDLDIIARKKPGSLSGHGSVRGHLGETESEGRLKEEKRIANIGVNLVRVETLGDDEVLTLVAYTTTNDEGEFLFSNLPQGVYRLNFQYPGVPMDETSFTTIDIGPGNESHFTVEANVKDGKISVHKLAITGIFQQEGYNLSVYPNPASEVLRLQFPNVVKDRTVVLSDMQGRQLHTQPITRLDTVISLNNLYKGMYILRVEEHGVNVKTLKLVIE